MTETIAMTENAIATKELRTFDELFDAIRWAHNRRRSWSAGGEAAGWFITVEILKDEDIDDIGHGDFHR